MSRLLPQHRATAERWADIARERGVDAVLLKDGGRNLAALYLLGYVVEAYAKALAQARGRSPRLSHDLILLLEDCGLRRQDLPPDLRSFADSRSVEMRYEPRLPAGVDFAVEFERGRRLAQFLSIRLNRIL